MTNSKGEMMIFTYYLEAWLWCRQHKVKFEPVRLGPKQWGLTV